MVCGPAKLTKLDSWDRDKETQGESETGWCFLREKPLIQMNGISKSRGALLNKKVLIMGFICVAVQ